MAKRWYSVSVLSNFEKKVAEAIRQAVAEKALEDEIEEVLVPTEEVIEIRRGKKVTSERRFMPGYVLVRMELSDKTYHLVNSINRVTGFLGALTTFSSFSAEVVEMLMVQRYALALGTTALHLLGSLGLTVLGMQSASYFIASRA